MGVLWGVGTRIFKIRDSLSIEIVREKIIQKGGRSLFQSNGTHKAQAQ